MLRKKVIKWLIKLLLPSHHLRKNPKHHEKNQKLEKEIK